MLSILENRKAQQVLSLFGLFGVVFYILHIVLGRIFYEGYNPFSQAISDLTALSSPSKNIASPLSFIYGIFTVTFSVGFLVYFKGKINKIISVGSCAFCFMNVISFFGYTFFPLSEAGYAATFQDKMHMVVTVLVVIFTIVSLVLFSIGFFRAKGHKWLGIVSITTLLALMVGAMLINILPKEYFGLAERVNVYSIIIYTGILSLWMNKYVEKGIN
jgi:hypothetical membrane protein